MSDSELRQALRVALRAAMKARDQGATSALRSALGAIDNAEAVDVSNSPVAASGPIAGAVLGVGAGEVQPRTLSQAELVAIVKSEIDERLSAAGHYEELGRVDEATRLRSEAAVLAEFL